MVPKALKDLIDNYCMGVTPSDSQMDEIMNLVMELGADMTEASDYIQKMLNGPTKKEREAKAEKSAKAAAERKAKKEAEEKILEDAKRKVLETADQAYVDLGLSVYWSTHNLGASSPDGFGDYYAWGETSPKKSYDWSTYAHSSETRDPQKKSLAKLKNQPQIAQVFKKYCTDAEYGKVDKMSTLQPSDDAASVNVRTKWKLFSKEKWRTPTDKEWEELLEKCTWALTTLKNVKGYLITGKNGNSIFLPAAGIIKDHPLASESDTIEYWSSSLCKGLCWAAKTCPSPDARKNPLLSGYNYEKRCYGLSIRPVLEK